jgi:hypothetical protein
LLCIGKNLKTKAHASSTFTLEGRVMKCYVNRLFLSMVAIAACTAIATGMLYGGVALWTFQCPGFSGALSVRGPAESTSAFCAVFGVGLLAYMPLALFGIGLFVTALCRYLASVRIANATIRRARRVTVATH